MRGTRSAGSPSFVRRPGVPLCLRSATQDACAVPSLWIAHAGSGGDRSGAVSLLWSFRLSHRESRLGGPCFPYLRTLSFGGDATSAVRFCFEAKTDKRSCGVQQDNSTPSPASRPFFAYGTEFSCRPSPGGWQPSIPSSNPIGDEVPGGTVEGSTPPTPHQHPINTRGLWADGQTPRGQRVSPRGRREVHEHAHGGRTTPGGAIQGESRAEDSTLMRRRASLSSTTTCSAD